jgi:cytochrome c-type biogenesis protein CcmH/NrfG
MAMAGAVVLAAQPRQPGNSDTGSISGSVAQQVSRLLSQAEIDQALGNVVNALIAYNEVLALEPRNPEALAQSGWLDFTAGSASKNLDTVRTGVRRLALAVRVAPTDPSARLYYAIAAASTPGSRAVAVAQMRIFLALRPNAHLMAIARPWLRALGVSPG